jgi:hypothetical protein
MQLNLLKQKQKEKQIENEEKQIENEEIKTSSNFPSLLRPCTTRVESMIFASRV